MNDVRSLPARTVRPVLVPALLAALVLAGVALSTPARAAGSAAAAKPASTPGSTIRVNLNTATSEELQALPGIGEARAGQILALRKERGAFRSVDELLEVRGIGPAMLERLRPQVSLSGKTRLGGAAPAGRPGR